MATLDEHAKRLCSVCGKPFYDPEQGARKDYRYTMRYVSDDHRVMFHSGNEADLSYDPEYYAAYDRVGKRTRDNVARSWAQYDEAHSQRERITRNALGDSTERS